MKIITQKQTAQRLGLDPSFFSKIMAGKSRPSAIKAAELEVVTGIGIRTWLYGRPGEIIRELERAYGKINFRRGRVPARKKVKR
jgi:transcriptional regulator with XRE-family HTH domain